MELNTEAPQEKPSLTVIEGGLSQSESQKIEPKIKSNLLTTIRRALSHLLEKADTNKENVPPPGKAF